MRPYDFQESVGCWLAMSHHAYMRAFNDRLAPYGITFRQAQIIGLTVMHGPQSQAALAGQMMIEPPSLVGVLDRMEEAGLIARRACGVDRRKKLVQLTDKVEPIWEQIVECGLAMRELATTGLTASEQETLRCLLAKVQANVGAEVSEPTVPMK